MFFFFIIHYYTYIFNHNIICIYLTIDYFSDCNTCIWCKRLVYLIQKKKKKMQE